MKEQTNGERFEEFIKTVGGYPELEGTTNLCEDIIEKKTGKMTEEEWQAAERAQTSTTDLIDSAIWSLSLDDKMKVWRLIDKLVEEEKETLYTEEEVIDFLQEMNDWPTTFEGRIDIREWFKQFKKK
jgi:hypothetical protein